MSIIRPSSRTLAAIPVLLLVATVLSGCISEAPPPPTNLRAIGTGGTIYQGWDYAGATAQPLNGSIEIDVDDPSNSGLVTVRGVWAGENFTITLSEFNHTADDFHDGGVAMHFPEHGASGNGNTLVPEMFLLLATWGPATFELGDEAFKDPYTGLENWSAHLMVTDTGIRDEADGGKVKSASSGIYSPDAPADAIIGTDNEVHLIIESTAPAGDIPEHNETVTGTAGGPMSETTMFPVPVQTRDANIRIEIDFGADPQEVGPYNAVLRDPEGKVIARQTMAGTQAMTKSATIEATSEVIGNHTLEVSGPGAPGEFTADITVTHPPRPFYWLHWEEVTIGAGGR
ncbi:MAG: hypothetical protein KY455_08170 [Euryarchaeota archaeon]|nr:hypothetical protein [Euryarchaeota archaeon]